MHGADKSRSEYFMHRFVHLIVIAILFLAVIPGGRSAAQSSVFDPATQASLVADIDAVQRPQVVSGLWGPAEPAGGLSPGGAFELRTVQQTPPTSACSHGQKGACCGSGEPSVAE